jgi:ATP/maltotriose-dependent transcriptional regulator MalT
MNLGDLRLAEDSIQKGLNFPTVYSFIEKPRLLAGAALLALTKGELEEANRRIEEARDYAEERGMRQFYPLIALIQGKVQVACGEIESGLESLDRAVSLAGSLDMRPTVWKAFAAASEALFAAGRDGEAKVKSEAARAVIQEIAGLFKDPDLRAAYLENALGKIRESSAIPG